MVLKGLEFTSWLGWLLGIFFVRKPWGQPKYTGLCHPYILFSLLLNFSNYFFWTDFHNKTVTLLAEYTVVDKIIFVALILAFNCSDIYFRIVLFIYRKEIPEFLSELENMKYGKVRDEFETCRKFHCWFSFVLFLPRCLCPVIILVWYYTYLPPNVWLCIKPPWYFVCFFIFAEIPNMFSIVFIYNLIVVSTFSGLRTFGDFADSLCDVITSRNSGNMINMQDCYLDNEAEKRISPIPSYGVMSIAESVSISEVRQDVIAKFENLKSLARKYDQVIGPLILGIVVRAVIMIVHATNSLLFANQEFEKHKGIMVLFNILVLVIEVSQLMLLKLGSDVQGHILRWKEELNKACILMDKSGGRNTDKRIIRDLVQWICKWKWKMSATGLFDIERKLLSSIVSTILSYIILLFQLKLSDSSDSTSSNATVIPNIPNL